MREPRHGYEVPVHARSFEIRESRTWDSYTREDFRIIARLGTRRNYETTKQRSLVSKRLDEIRQTMSYRNCIIIIAYYYYCILITDFMMADESYRLNSKQSCKACNLSREPSKSFNWNTYNFMQYLYRHLLTSRNIYVRLGLWEINKYLQTTVNC